MHDGRRPVSHNRGGSSGRIKQRGFEHRREGGAEVLRRRVGASQRPWTPWPWESSATRRAPLMAPPAAAAAAATAQHRPRSTVGAADAAPMVMATAPVSMSTTTKEQNHQQHQHHRRAAGVPLLSHAMVASGTGTPPIDVVRYRRTYSTSSARGIPPQVCHGCFCLIPL